MKQVYSRLDIERLILIGSKIGKKNPLLIHWCQSHKIIKGIFPNYNVLIAKIVLPNETIRKWDNSFYWMWGKSWLSNQKTSTSLIHFSFPCDKTIKYLELIKLHRHKIFDVKALEDITRNLIRYWYETWSWNLK